MTAKHYKDLPMSDYQASTDYLSKTMLGIFADCPAKFKYNFIDGKYASKDTPSFARGAALHTMALEPEKWLEEYIVLDVDKRTKEGKQAWADAEATGKQIIRQGDYDLANGMANALTDNPLALALLSEPGYVESSIFWEEGGIKFKCRPDLMRNDGLLIDVKTCNTADPEKFKRDAFNFKYHVSVALSCRGYKALYGKEPEEYVFLCVESEAPHVVSCFTTFDAAEMAGMSVREYGDAQLDMLIDQYKECINENKWPEYQTGIKPLGLPTWI